MLICNRGEQRQPASIKPFKIDRGKMTLEDIYKLKSQNFTSDTGPQYFYQDLPASLGSQPNDFICKIIEEHCKQSDQKIGNCWWASPKSAVLGLMTIQNLLKADFLLNEDKEEAFKHIVDSTQNFYKYYTEFARIQVLKEYLEREPDKAGRDHALVKAVADKLQSKEWKYVFDDRSRLNKIFDWFSKMVGKKSKTILPPLYTQQKVNGWLSDYRKKHRLDQNFNPLPFVEVPQKTSLS